MHAEAILILLYLISMPVLITVFAAFRGPVDVLLFSSLTPQQLCNDPKNVDHFPVFLTEQREPEPAAAATLSQTRLV